MSEDLVDVAITLQIETVSTCNASCHFCVYSKNAPWRAGKSMTDELYKKIIDEAATIPYIRTLILQGLNEPLLDRKLVERVQYATDVMPEGVVKNIFTNGVYLYPWKFDALRKAGLNSCIVSLNAVNQEQHEKIMGISGKFEQTCKNVEHMIANRGDMKNIQVDAVYNDDQFTEEDCYVFLERWGIRQEGDGVGLIVKEGNWAGESRTIRLPREPGKCCNRALSALYVQYNGHITSCCFDPFGENNFGDLTKDTIRDVFNSEKHTKFRSDHFEDKADRWEICAKCSRI